MSQYQNLESILLKHSDNAFAAGQKAYMRHRFSFLGLRQPIRKKIQRPFLQEATKKDIPILWEKEEREYQYIAIDLLIRSTLEEKDFELLEWLITTKSWWDSVDILASNVGGKFFLQFPNLLEQTERWSTHENMWLRRSSLIFQLRYKEKTDETRLFSYCQALSKEKEFFIQKAIGWALREYSKTAPERVRRFCNKQTFSRLIVREALQYIKNNVI
jgi:3-methyladenine DNA glycosylase AlkD